MNPFFIRLHNTTLGGQVCTMKIITLSDGHVLMRNTTAHDLIVTLQAGYVMARKRRGRLFGGALH
jgi:hypothetical protein